MSETESNSDTNDTTNESPTERTIPKARFELYEDAAAEWRWRFVHRNGEILADSSEGYTSRADAHDGLDAVRALAPTARVEEHSDG